MLSILFSLPEGILPEMMDYVSAIFTDGKLLIILAIGVPMAFYFIKKIIALAPKG
jgi:hypothetical protein